MDGYRNDIQFAIESKKKQHEASYFMDVGTKYQDLRLEVHGDPGIDYEKRKPEARYFTEREKKRREASQI
jgi:hypothetical protein